MSVYIGGFDPLKLIEGILNKLVQKGILTREEAQVVIDEAKAPDLGKENKNEQSDKK